MEAVLPILPKIGLKGTLDVIEVAFELFGPNKMFTDCNVDPVVLRRFIQIVSQQGSMRTEQDFLKLMAIFSKCSSFAQISRSFSNGHIDDKINHILSAYSIIGHLLRQPLRTYIINLRYNTKQL